MDRDDEREVNNKSMNTYYEKTKFNPPKKMLKGLVEKLKPGNALELGVGAGSDTTYLLQNNWAVDSVDINDVEKMITSSLRDEEKERFKFLQDKFQNLELKKEAYNLIIAYYSLHYLKRDEFFRVFEKIEKSIKKGGYFSGTFLGNNDSWKEDGKEYTFLTETEVRNLFSNFENVKLCQIDEDGKTTGAETPKHWHVFKVVAKK